MAQRGRGGVKDIKGTLGDNVYKVKNTGKKMVSGSSSDSIGQNRDLNARRQAVKGPGGPAQYTVTKMTVPMKKTEALYKSTAKKSGGGKTQRAN